MTCSVFQLPTTLILCSRFWLGFPDVIVAHMFGALEVSLK